eukprot:2540782-Amphidinium_carterae.1
MHCERERDGERAHVLIGGSVCLQVGVPGVAGVKIRDWNSGCGAPKQRACSEVHHLQLLPQRGSKITA